MLKYRTHKHSQYTILIASFAQKADKKLYSFKNEYKNIEIQISCKFVKIKEPAISRC